MEDPEAVKHGSYSEYLAMQTFYDFIAHIKTIRHEYVSNHRESSTQIWFNSVIYIFQIIVFRNGTKLLAQGVNFEPVSVDILKGSSLIAVGGEKVGITLLTKAVLDSVPTFSMAVILILFQYGMTVFWLPEMFLNLILKIHCTMWIQSLKEWF